MRLINSRLSPSLIAMGAAFLAVTLYWAGLDGPILFDDYWNLAPVSRWISDEQAWPSVLFPNPNSIVDSRPVAMASFMATSWIFGDTTFGLKLGNLVLHLVCALLALGVIRRAVDEDPRLVAYRFVAPVLLTTIWLLHPLHVSTVLYGVQRMAQLSTALTLVSIHLYFLGRQRLSEGRAKTAIGLLFLAFPSALAMGLLAKQNAAVAGLLCLVFELAYFRFRGPGKKLLVTFFLAFAGTPVILMCVILAIRPERILAAYADLEFGMVERLLTQPRVVCDYIGMWFVPRSPKMGLYTDDFPVSFSLLSDPSPLLAIIALLTGSAVATALRKNHPSIFAGWFFFLVAHAVESTFIPLEMYYEHRNYLPSFGLLLMAAGVVVALRDRLRLQGFVKSKFGAIAYLALVAALCFSTLGRVLVWQSERSMVEQGVRYHPGSIRLRLDRTALALREERYDDAVSNLMPMIESRDDRTRTVGKLDLVAVRCVRGDNVTADQLEAALRDASPTVTVAEVYIATLFEAVTRPGRCENISAADFASALIGLLDRAKAQPEHSESRLTIRRIAAQLYARGGDWKSAEFHAALGWSIKPSISMGSVLTRSYAKNGKPEMANEIFEGIRKLVRSSDTHWHAELDALESVVLAAKANAGANDDLQNE